MSSHDISEFYTIFPCMLPPESCLYRAVCVGMVHESVSEHTCGKEDTALWKTRPGGVCARHKEMPKRARSASGGASAEAAGPVTVDLCLSSDEDEDNDPSKARATQPARRSSRLEERERPHDAQKLICFPPSGSAKETITLTYGDLRRLRPSDGTAQAFIPTDQLLLNDQLVDFYVKYLLQPLPEQPPTQSSCSPG